MKAERHRNVTWAELAIGQEAAIERSVTAHDLYVYAHASGNTNPVHRPDETRMSDTEAPALWLGALVSTVLETVLPGAGTLHRSQEFRFLARAHLGDRLRIAVRCIEKREPCVAIFETKVTTTAGQRLLEGKAVVDAPQTPVFTADHELPLLLLDECDHFGGLIARCRQLQPLVTAVVCPDERNALEGVILSWREKLIAPILIGDRTAILATAAALGEDVSALPLIHLPDPEEAASRAVAMARAGEAQAVMKGNLHSDTLLRHILKPDGLKGSRRLSHVFAMDVPTLPHLLFISDAAINIAPDLAAKVDIVQKRHRPRARLRH